MEKKEMKSSAQGKLKGLCFFLGLAVVVSGGLNAGVQASPAQNQPASLLSASAPQVYANDASPQITPTSTPAPRLRLSGEAVAAGEAPADSVAADVSAQDCTNLLQDPGFEAGVPNPYWGGTSDNFGTPLCTPGSCDGVHPN